MAIVPSVVLVVGGTATLVASGPFALLFLPLFLPPMVFFCFYGRAGAQLARGDARAAASLVALSLVYVVLLVPAGVIGWPGPTSNPVPMSELPNRLRLAYLGGAASALYAIGVAGLALTSRRGDARATSRTVLWILIVGLVTVAVAALGLPIAGRS